MKKIFLLSVLILQSLAASFAVAASVAKPEVNSRSTWQGIQDLSQAVKLKMPIATTVGSQGPVRDTPRIPDAAPDNEQLDPEAEPHTTDTDLMVGN